MAATAARYLREILELFVSQKFLFREEAEDRVGTLFGQSQTRTKFPYSQWHICARFSLLSLLTRSHTHKKKKQNKFISLWNDTFKRTNQICKLVIYYFHGLLIHWTSWSIWCHFHHSIHYAIPKFGSDKAQGCN